MVKPGFDNFIRWGKDDDQSRPDAREDVMEAIVAAVAVDCDWDMDIVEDVVEELLNIHLALDPWTPEKDHFDILNSWWQKRFGVRPEYRIHKSADTYTDGRALYECDLTISLSMLDPERDWDAWCSDSDWEEHALVYGKYGEDITFHSRRISKSEARSMCAEQCIQFLKAAGLFMNLKDCGVTPRLDDAINQLQILHQRGYVGEARYEFIDGDDFWECTCTVDSFWDGADAAGKKESKKLAAFSVLIQIMRSAGIDDPEWEKVFERPGGNLSI